jgi:hypothetical protein
MFGKPQISPELLMGLGGGILSGPNLAAGLGQGFQQASNIMTVQRQEQELKEGENKTRAFVQKMFPNEDVANMPPEILKSYANQAIQQRFAKPEKPNIMNAGNGLLYNSDTGQWIQPPADMMQNQRPDLGLNPQYGVDANGNPVLLQLGKDGNVVQSKLPDGVTLSKQPIKLDAGTHFVLLDPITRQPVGTVPKDIAEVEKQKVLGETEGKQVAAAPADLQAGLNAKSLIEELRTDPNREWGTGWSAITGSIPGTPAYDYQTKVNQAKSGAFLTAIQQLRGMGSLSNAEGSTATSAVTRMNAATSEAEFMDALDDYEKIIDQGIQRAQSKVPTTAEQPNSNGVNTTSQGVQWRKK